MKYSKIFTIEVSDYLDGTLIDWESEGITEKSAIAEATEIQLHNHVVHHQIMHDLPTWCEEEECEEVHDYEAFFITVDSDLQEAKVEVWWESGPLELSSEEESSN